LPFAHHRGSFLPFGFGKLDQFVTATIETTPAARSSLFTPDSQQICSFMAVTAFYPAAVTAIEQSPVAPCPASASCDQHGVIGGGPHHRILASKSFLPAISIYGFAAWLFMPAAS
jgi:hypothetical protein